MTCHDALLLLEFARPGATELEAADIAALETHLADCPACNAFARAERQSHERLAAALAVVPASPNGPTKLRAKIAQQRHQWQWRSALIVAGCFGFAGATWWAIPGPRIDTGSILATIQEQIGNLDGANEWLTTQNSQFGFPPRFRVNYLVTFERRDFHGTMAPVLTFVHGNSIARVAVVTAKQFRNLSEFTPGRVAENSSASILILLDPDRPGVVYIVEVINGPIEPFMTEEKSSAT